MLMRTNLRAKEYCSKKSHEFDYPPLFGRPFKLCFALSTFLEGKNWKLKQIKLRRFHVKAVLQSCTQIDYRLGLVWIYNWVGEYAK